MRLATADRQQSQKGEYVNTLRGRAAIVGVTDAASPTGELELSGVRSRRRW